VVRIPAEDARFYQHDWFDWQQIQIAAEDDLEGGRTRGASTLTQQLVNNLLFGTGRSFLRKAAEFTLVLSGPARAHHHCEPGAESPTRGRIHLRRLYFV
jgi:hypothetical protein